MASLPVALDKLVALIARLPGIGERTATRLAFHVLSEPGDYATELARALDGVVERIDFCTRCHHIAEGPLCGVCQDNTRDETLLCIVAGIPDLLAFERSSVFRGRYHVLHGVLAPLKGVLPDNLRIQNLRERIEGAGVREVIVATPTGVEGEATALYLARLDGFSPGAHFRMRVTGITPEGLALEGVADAYLHRRVEPLAAHLVDERAEPRAQRRERLGAEPLGAPHHAHLRHNLRIG